MNWIDPVHALDKSGDFIRGILGSAGRESVVVGLSGGIDSAVSAAVTVRAVGADRVRGVMMPYRTSSAASLTDGAAVAENLGLEVEKVEITPMADAFLAAMGEADRIRRGNVMARCRMIVLYDRSARDGSLVLGTGNRTESLLGYTTMYGDNACAFNPIGQLYKTEIRALAAHLKLPQTVLDKAPSADLWEGQADEDELGVSYAEVDRLLVHMVDEGLGRRQLTALGFAPELIERVAARMRATAFKRVAPLVCPFAERRDPDYGPAGSGEDSGKDGGFH